MSMFAEILKWFQASQDIFNHFDFISNIYIYVWFCNNERFQQLGAYLKYAFTPTQLKFYLFFLSFQLRKKLKI